LTKRIDERQRGSTSARDPAAGSNVLVPAAPARTREEFSAAFDRCFSRVHAYVSRRVDDSKSCQRIVREVLTENLDLLADPGDERRECSQLKASSDRRIEMESARSVSVASRTIAT
jgi:hypothetical protein